MNAENGLLKKLWQRAKRASLRWQICVLTGLTLLVSMGIVSYVGYSQSIDAVTKAKLDMLEAETGVGVSVVEQYLDITRQDVIQVPKFPPIPGIMRCLDNNGEDPDPLQTGSTTEIWLKRLGTILKAQMEGRPERLKATMTLADGRELARVERDGKVVRLVADDPQDFEPASLLADALATRPGRVSISDAQFDEVTGHRTVHLATPFVDGSGQTRGVLSISLDVDRIFQQVSERIPSGVTDIVDDSGQYIFSGEHADYARNGRAYSNDKPVRAALLADNSSKDTYRRLIPGHERPDGVSLVAIYQKIYFAGSDRTRFWAIAPSINADIALAEVTELGRSFLWLALLVIAGGGAFTFVASKGLTSALQQLTHSANRVAQGDLDAEDLEGEPMGEVRELRDALSTMKQNLRETLEKTRQTEQRTSAILNSTADGIMSIGENGIIRSINAAAARLFGIRREEGVGQNAGQLVPGLYNEDEQYASAPLAEGEVRAIGGENEMEGLHRNGRKLPLAVRVTEMDHAGERLYIATLQDITARRKAENERRLAEEERARNEQERDRLMGGVEEAVRDLSAASAQILASTTEQAASSQQQAASVTETATTIEELTHTADEATGRAKEVADSAHRADEVGQRGRAAVHATIDAMQNVREQVQSIADNIMTLAERARAISGIIDTVNDIADQTNLLALNAAIEASRAGEHGRGFAVVASEVKALAEQSRKATEKVAQILGEVKDATNTSVMATEQGTKSVGEAEHVIREAENTIEALGQTVSASAISASQILASANQQATAMRQIRDAMGHIDSGTRQTLAATRQSEQSARDLNQLGKRLSDLVNKNDDANDSSLNNGD